MAPSFADECTAAEPVVLLGMLEHCSKQVYWKLADGAVAVAVMTLQAMMVA